MPALYKRRTICTLFAAALFTATVPAGAKARSLTVADMRQMVDFTEPAIAPGASRIAVVLLRAERPSLLIVDSRTGVQQTAATGGNVALPRWSPDGSLLGYLREDRSGIEQIYVMHGSSTPVQLTHSSNGITDFAWRPDGKALAYVAPDSTSPRAFFYAGDNDYTATSLTPPAHLWLISANGGGATRLTSGSWSIAQPDDGGTFQSQISWSRDGRRIAFTRVENTFSGDSERSTIWEVDVASHRLQSLPHIRIWNSHRRSHRTAGRLPIGMPAAATSWPRIRFAREQTGVTSI